MKLNIFIQSMYCTILCLRRVDLKFQKNFNVPMTCVNCSNYISKFTLLTEPT